MLPAALVRPRLTSALSEGRDWFVEAPAGWGKTIVLTQLACAVPGVLLVAPGPRGDGLAGLPQVRRGLAAVLRLSGRSDAAAIVEAQGGSDAGDGETLAQLLLASLEDADDPGTLVVDDLHRADPAVAAFLAALLQRSPVHPLRLVVAGRSPAEGLDLRRTVRLSAADLALDAAEARELWRLALPGECPDGAQALRDRVEGWPLAYAMALQRIAAQPAAERGHELERLLRNSAAVSRVAADIADGLPPAQRTLLAEIASLPMVDEVVLDGLGGDGTAQALRAAGVPWMIGHDGWWRLPEVFAGSLRTTSAPLTAGTARLVAQRYGERGEAAEAVRLLVRSGLVEAACELISRLGGDSSDDLDPVTTELAVGSLPEGAYARHVPALTAYARMLGQTLREQERDAFLDRAIRTVEQTEPGSELPLRAERCCAAAWPGSSSPYGTVEHCRSLLAVCPASDIRTRGRLLEALGQLLGYSTDPGEVVLAQSSLRTAVELALAAGMRTEAIRALQTLAYHVHLRRGAFAQAEEALGDAEVLSRPYSVERIRLMCYRADLLVAAGRTTEAADLIDAAERLCAPAGRPGMLALAAWERVNLAGVTGDREGAETAVRQVLASPLMGSGLGSWFLSEAAWCLARLGALELAEELAGQAWRRGDAPQIAGIARLAVQCRAGGADLAAVDRLVEETLGHPDTEPRHRWRVLLYQATAHLRARSPQASALAATALADGVVGGVDLPAIHEPELAAAAREQGDSAGETEAVTEVIALGGLQVFRQGRGLPAAGRAPDLLLATVLAGRGRADTWTVVEALWPDVDPEVGRRRLRNVLTRARAAYGDIVERSGEELRLQPGVRVDAYDLVAAAEEARLALVRGDVVRAETAALRAVGRGQGPALPGVDTEQVAGWREEVRLDRLACLALLADRAEADGRVDAAVRWLEAAHAEEPWEERWLVRAVLLLARSGRPGSAARLARRGIEASEEMGVPPARELLAAAG